ncbi:MAG: GtrA family protein [Acidobacteria bacterium]|nr:GtrA family protein [Acidobacteriota bacterium]
MNTLARWWKFNVVGAGGMVVQLASLAAMNWWHGGHYLIASGVAVEAAVLHNFVWHLRYTWRDRRDGSGRLGQLVRFHLSNGMTSMVGNLGLMRLLVGEAHLPVVPANAIAVVCCSVVNFWLGHRWVFGVRRVAPESCGG